MTDDSVDERVEASIECLFFGAVSKKGKDDRDMDEVVGRKQGRQQPLLAHE